VPEGPFRVIRVDLTVRRSLPDFPHKRTFSGPVGMSQTCNNRRPNADQSRLVGMIEFGDKPCQVCCGPRTGFAQTLKNAYPFGSRRRAGIPESGA
jgi:hypothetical protein